MTGPNPLEWTLRLKARKTTVLLLVDPLDKFSTIKSALFAALQDTGVKDPETGEALSLPQSPAEIQLGRPVNINDPEAGFKLGEWEYDGSVSGEDDGGKGKGKAKAGPRKSNGANAAMDCPKGAGLKDGSVLAFRWKSDGVWDGAEPDLDIDEDEIAAEGAKCADMWGIKLANYDDAYGVEESMDVGGGKPYEG